MTGTIFRLGDRRASLRSTRRSYDVIIVGAGVVGCALARRISQTGLAVAVIDRANDVGEGGASKSNSAIAHCGFDAEPGSLEAKLVTTASKQWPLLAKHLKIPFNPVGALMLARTAGDMEALKKYHKRALLNGVDDVQLLGAKAARDMEPLAFEGEELIGGLHIPRESIVDPFATTEAYAETSLVQGNCDFFFEAEVDQIKQVTKEEVVVAASKQSLELVGKNLINSAGLGAGVLAALYNGTSFTLNPRRGQFLVYDSLSRPLLNKILLPVPGPLGKGILITPTIFGNLLAGPTAEDLSMAQVAEGTQTTVSGLEQVRNSVERSLPSLKQFKPITQYAGARSNCQEGQFLFRYGDGNNSNIVTLAGIRSTGLSTSFAVADEVFSEMLKRRMIYPKHEFQCQGRLAYPTWFQNANLQKGDGTLGRKRQTICFCEGVDKDDIVQTLRSPMAPKTTDGVKRRTRATTGRCQGFNCLVDICRIISSEARVPVRLVSKRGPGTEWFPNYSDTLPPGYIRSPLLKSSELFARMELYNSAVSPIAWNNDERFQVVVVGAGPAGLGVISSLAESVKLDKVLLIERSDRIGGIPARYSQNDGEKTFVHWTKLKMVSGFEFAEELREELFSSPNAQKISLKLGSTVMTIVRDGDAEAFRVTTHDGHSFLADSVVFATGAREATSTERGCVTGHRTAKSVFSNHLLATGGVESIASFASGSGPVISLGAGLVARSILTSPNVEKAVQFIRLRQDEAPNLAQLYFHGSDPRADCKEFRVWAPRGTPDSFEYNGLTKQACSAIVLAGCLVPNNEALIRSSLKWNALPRRVFTAGNVQPSFLGPWPGVACYLHAKTVVANQVLKDFY